jgi:hypothetical protein
MVALPEFGDGGGVVALSATPLAPRRRAQANRAADMI